MFKAFSRFLSDYHVFHNGIHSWNLQNGRCLSFKGFDELELRSLSDLALVNSYSAAAEYLDKCVIDVRACNKRIDAAIVPCSRFLSSGELRYCTQGLPMAFVTLRDFSAIRSEGAELRRGTLW